MDLDLLLKRSLATSLKELEMLITSGLKTLTMGKLKITEEN